MRPSRQLPPAPRRGRLDRHPFLRPELDENRKLIDTAALVEFEAGDALFFHCRLFHAVGKNRTGGVKLSAVFTCHAGDDRPIPGTRSDRSVTILLQVWRTQRRFMLT